ncbi:MAG: hypothetical protein CYG61_10125, partial [Actinobacteria bacterium]
ASPPVPRVVRPADEARAALGAIRSRPPVGTDRAEERAPAAITPPAAARPAPTAAMPSRDELTKAWGDTVYRSLSGKARARFSGGRFSEVKDGTAVFVVPNDAHAARCREVKDDVESALAAHFGVAVPLALAPEQSRPSPGGPHSGPSAAGAAGVTGEGGAPDAEEDDADPFAPAEAFGPGDPAPAPVASPADRLKQAFPGAEEVSP